MIIQCVPKALELNCISIPYICNGFTRVRSIFAHVQVLEHKPPKFPYPVLFASISGIPGGEVNGGTVFDFLFATYCFFFLSNAYLLPFDNFRFWGNIFVWTLSNGLAC